MGCIRPLPHQGQAVQIDASHWASRPATHHTSGRQVAGTMKWRCAQSSSHYQGKPTGSETFCVYLILNWVHHVISPLLLCCRPVTVDSDSDPHSCTRPSLRPHFALALRILPLHLLHTHPLRMRPSWQLADCKTEHLRSHPPSL